MNPIKKKTNNKTRLPITGHGHFVQFYEADHELLDNLTAYINEGLGKGEVCIVIATESHRQQLAKRLNLNPVFIKASLAGKYIELDAAETLSRFMRDGMPDSDLFARTVGKLLRQTEKHSKSIRLYGEMVALLWRQGEKAAVIKLEQLWNGLLEGKSAPLYCAYPAMQFFMENDARQNIQSLHQPAEGSTI